MDYSSRIRFSLDEEYIKPVLSPVSLTKELITTYSCNITCQIKGTKDYATAEYDRELDCLWFIGYSKDGEWIDEVWEDRGGESVLTPDPKFGLDLPITLISTVEILGVRDRVFLVDELTHNGKAWSV
ncbi:MAG: hypothetical protein AAF086_02095 [Planctomycetota bacterium]